MRRRVLASIRFLRRCTRHQRRDPLTSVACLRTADANRLLRHWAVALDGQRQFIRRKRWWRATRSPHSRAASTRAAVYVAHCDD